MYHPISRFILSAVVALSVAACASRKGPDRPELSPERKQDLYSRALGKWDINNDNVINCDDINILRTELFATLDTDGNGKLTPQEYRYAQFDDKSYQFYTYSAVNKNNSDGIDFAEFAAIRHSEFAGLDRDRSCIVTVEEAAEALRDLFRERRGSGRRQGPERRPLPDID